jgi:hypothetical protein
MDYIQEGVNLHYQSKIEELKTKLAQVEARNREYEKVIEINLIPIFDSTCEGCRQAERVARNALNSGKGE